MPHPKFRTGDRVEDRETQEAGTVMRMPRKLAAAEPQLIAVLIDGTDDAIVYHRDDLRRTPSKGGRS
jgi:hypothetical protein